MRRDYPRPTGDVATGATNCEGLRRNADPGDGRFAAARAELLFQTEILDLARDRVATYAEPRRCIDAPAMGVLQSGADDRCFEVARESVHHLRRARLQSAFNLGRQLRHPIAGPGPRGCHGYRPDRRTDSARSFA